MVYMLKTTDGNARLVPFAYGFRPFFLLSLAYAVVAIGLWLVFRAQEVVPLPTLPPHMWHAHEMLFGFIGAAIAGFLLTAVPSWTGSKGFAGWPLALLAALWLAGRLAFALATDLPVTAVAAIELLFLPCLAAFIAPPLLRSLNRNTFVLGVLAMLWFADAVYLCAFALGDTVLATRAIHGGIDLVLVLVTVIGGRIVPAFTANALRSRGKNGSMRSWPWLEAVTIASMVALALADILVHSSLVLAIVAAIAAVAHAIRMSGWQGHRTLSQPIVWILHAGYAWLPLGLALKAVYELYGFEWSARWLHALTMGAAATMIVAVITRASLGHTGRPLVVDRNVSIAYGLILGATLVRVFGSLALPYEISVWVAGVLWLGSFVLLLARYLPILLLPRADRRPG
jgi:uncharacterized protein involved in response to NO